MQTLLREAEFWLTPVYIGFAVLAAISGGAIVGLIGVSVAMRHIANAPFSFTEELVGLLMTAAFFLALPLVTLRAEHVRVQILLATLPHRVGRWVGVGAGFLGIAFCIWFFLLCIPWLDFAFDRQIKTEVARLLMYPWMALLPVSMLLTAAAFLIRGVSGANAPKSGNDAEPNTARKH